MRVSVILSRLVFFLLFLASILVAQETKRSPSSPYLVLDTRKTSTMQKELTKAAADGYRVVTGSPTSGAIIVIVLKKVAEPPDTYEYLILANTRISTMQKELDDASARGFRLIPSTVVIKDRRFGGIETIVVMEKSPGSQNRYQYLIVASRGTSALQELLIPTITEGYSIVGMVARGKRWVILERPAVN